VGPLINSRSKANQTANFNLRYLIVSLSRYFHINPHAGRETAVRGRKYWDDWVTSDGGAYGSTLHIAVCTVVVGRHTQQGNGQGGGWCLGLVSRAHRFITSCAWDTLGGPQRSSSHSRNTKKGHSGTAGAGSRMQCRTQKA
jgi:hypothetical protein